MKAFLSIGLLWAASLAQAAVPSPFPVRQSQQITVIDVRPVSAGPPTALHSSSGADLLHLDSDVLLLSAVRIKEALLTELALPDKVGRLQLVLYHSSKAEDLISVISTFSPGGWESRLEIPDQVEPQKLIRGMVHGLLLEIANRGQGAKSAELPLWLVEGMTMHMIAVNGEDLVIGSIPVGLMRRTVRDRRGLDYLENARQVLRASPALSFSELAYPGAGTLRRDRLKVYQCSAQLFVYELLHFQKRPASLVSMLRELPRCWNWETALLRGFSADFKRMLDVEKKWSVDVLSFTAKDPSQVWSKVLCLDQLDEVLSVPAQIRLSPNTLPERRTLTLRQMISTWDFTSQTPVLRQKLAQLQALRNHSTAELVPLIDSYSKTLAGYLQKRALAGRSPETRMQATVNASLVAQDVVKDLEVLDQRREAFRPGQSVSVNSPIRP